MELSIRMAEDRDLPRLTAIYNQAVALKSATADLSPVSEESRRHWLSEHSPDDYPVYVAEAGGVVIGWCSLSAYRRGRMALRHTAELSYYVDQAHRGGGVGSSLISHAMDDCARLSLRTLFAIVLDANASSTRILEKFGFQRWGHLPRVADFDGRECGHLYYGRRVE